MEKEKERSVQAAVKKDEKRTLEHEAVVAKIKAGTEKERRSTEEFMQRQRDNEKMRKLIEANLDKYDVKKILKQNPHFLDEVVRNSRRHYHYINGTSSEREHLQNNNLTDRISVEQAAIIVKELEKMWKKMKNTHLDQGYLQSVLLAEAIIRVFAYAYNMTNSAAETRLMEQGAEIDGSQGKKKEPEAKETKKRRLGQKEKEREKRRQEEEKEKAEKEKKRKEEEKEKAEKERAEEERKRNLERTRVAREEQSSRAKTRRLDQKEKEKERRRQEEEKEKAEKDRAEEEKKSQIERAKMAKKCKENLKRCHEEEYETNQKASKERMAEKEEAKKVAAAKKQAEIENRKRKDEVGRKNNIPKDEAWQRIFEQQSEVGKKDARKTEAEAEKKEELAKEAEKKEEGANGCV